VKQKFGASTLDEVFVRLVRPSAVQSSQTPQHA
jgi:hypothetical protein